MNYGQLDCFNPFLTSLFIKKCISICIIHLYNNTGIRVNSFVARQLDQTICIIYKIVPK